MRKNILIISIFIIVALVLIFSIYSQLTKKDLTENLDVNTVTSNPFEVSGALSKTIDKTNPKSTTESCFSWYIKGSSASGSIDDAINQPQISECFSEEYISQFGSIISKTGADPILLVQDTGNSWSTSVAATSIGEDQTSAKTRVLVGTGDEATVYLVTLSKHPQKSWLITSVQRAESI